MNEEQINTPNGIDKVAAAFVKAQAEFLPIARNCVGQVGPRQYKYADLADVLAAVRPALTKYELAVTQSVHGDYVSTRIWHSSGQFLTGLIPLVQDDSRRGPQGLGSAVTYARRYGLSALLGVVSEEDDDGAAAQGGQRAAGTKGGAASAPRREPPPARTPPRTGKTADWKDKVATAAQVKALWVLWGKAGYGEDDMRQLLKNEYNLTSTKDLKAGECSKLIDDLKKVVDK